jgi:L-2-hydroxyglutarate oxidase LhgO
MDSDIIIIGAGVVGLSVASSISKKYPDKEIYVLERHEKFGQETSSRNSEVIHAGIYYTPNSLKARLCHEGRDMIYQLAEQGNVEAKKIGKLIVATNDEDVEQLHQIKENAKKNDVELEFLAEEKVKELEPKITAKAALFSPESGIVNSHGLMEYFLRNAQQNGVAVAFACEVQRVDKIDGGYSVTVNDEGGEYPITTKVLINCAGLEADKIANMLGLDYTQYYCKGDYFGVTNGKNKLISHLIYPTPEKKNVGLGIHMTLDLQGGMRLGPDTEYIERTQCYDIDEGKKQAFYESVKRFAPFIELEDIYTDMSGIRPKIQAPGEVARDFIIKEEMPGFINLMGIESPGLTSSPAIGKYVAEMI